MLNRINIIKCTLFGIADWNFEFLFGLRTSKNRNKELGGGGKFIPLLHFTLLISNAWVSDNQHDFLTIVMHCIA